MFKILNKKNFISLFLILFIANFLVMNIANGGNIFFDPNSYGSIIPNPSLTPDSSAYALNLGTNSPLAISMQILWIISSLLGLAFLILILYAGATWLLARGNEEQIEKSKKILKRSLIGLLIVLLSVSIAYLIYELIRYAMSGDDTLETYYLDSLDYEEGVEADPLSDY